MFASFCDEASLVVKRVVSPYRTSETFGIINMINKRVLLPEESVIYNTSRASYLFKIHVSSSHV